MVAMLKRSLSMLQAGPGKLATTNDSRTRGSQWQAIRARVMRRDGGLCQCCIRFGHHTIGAEVDHNRPLWAGGSDALHNLQTICQAHHRAKTRAEEAQRMVGAAWAPWSASPLGKR